MRGCAEGLLFWGAPQSSFSDTSTI